MKKMEANREALQALDERCKQLMESIVTPLKGKREFQVSVELNDSLGRLARYDRCISCSIIYISGPPQRIMYTLRRIKTV
jgi:hypothetical protein